MPFRFANYQDAIHELQQEVNDFFSKFESDKNQTIRNPFFGDLYETFVEAVARPSKVTGAKYNQVSSEFFNAAHDVLSGKGEAGDRLADLESTLDRLSRGGRW